MANICDTTYFLKGSENAVDDEECDFYTTFEDAIERWINVMQDYVNILLLMIK
jgi:hypothetical protein